MKKRTKTKMETNTFAKSVGQALRRSARTARKIARRYGTPVYIWKDGRVVAEKP